MRRTERRAAARAERAARSEPAIGHVARRAASRAAFRAAADGCGDSHVVWAVVSGLAAVIAWEISGSVYGIAADTFGRERVVDVALVGSVSLVISIALLWNWKMDLWDFVTGSQRRRRAEQQDAEWRAAQQAEQDWIAKAGWTLDAWARDYVASDLDQLAAVWTADAEARVDGVRDGSTGWFNGDFEESADKLAAATSAESPEVAAEAAEIARTLANGLRASGDRGSGSLTGPVAGRGEEALMLVSLALGYRQTPPPGIPASAMAHAETLAAQLVDLLDAAGSVWEAERAVTGARRERTAADVVPWFFGGNV